MNEEPTLKEKALERLLETSRVRASSVNTPPISSSLLEKPLTSKHQHLKDDQYRHTQETLIQQQKNSDNYTSKNGEKIEQREAKAVILENPKVPLYLDRYIVTKVLGEGSYGRVKLATDAFTGEKVALKVFQKATIKKMVHITRIKREVYIMRLLNHPNIVKLYDVMETEKEIILSMEYINGGELFDYIVAQKRVKERMARRFFRQIVSALDYCHKSCIIHRDLKPENLLLDQDRNIRIIDFGFVNLFDPGDVMKTFCGSPYYASPEMIGSKKYIGPEVDIWSLGVILFALLAGHLPFRDSNTAELYKKISSSSYEIPEYFSKESRDLIKRMLTVDPLKRATIDEIKSHIWTLGTSETAPEDLVPPRPIPKSVSEIDMGVVSRMAAYGFDTTTVTQQILNCGNGSSGSSGGVVSPPFALYCLLREQDDREKKLEVHSPKTKHGAVIVERFAGDGGAAEYAELDKSKGKEKDFSEKNKNGVVVGIGVGDYVLENAALDLVPVTYQATSGSGNGESVTSTPNVRKHRAQVERQSSTGEHSSRDGSPTPIGTVSKKQTSLSRKSSSRRKEDTSSKPDEENSNIANSNDASTRKETQQQQDLLSVVANNPRGVSPGASPRPRTRPTSFIGTTPTSVPSGGSRQRSVTNTSDTSQQHNTNFESNHTIFTATGTQNQDQYEQSEHLMSRRETPTTVIPSQLQQPQLYLSARVGSSRRERSISSPPVSNVNYNSNTHIDTIPIPQSTTTNRSKEMSGSALKLPQLNKSRNGSIVSMRSQDAENISPTSPVDYTPQTIDQVIQKRESTQFRASTSSRPVSTYDEYSKRELSNSTTDSPALKKSRFKEAFKNTFKKMTKSGKKQSSATSPSPKNSASNDSSISSLVSSVQSSVQSLSPLSGNSGVVGSQQHLQQQVQLSNANLQQPPTTRPRGTVRARPVSYHAGQKPIQGVPLELANFMGPISSNDDYSSRRSLVKNSPLGVNVSSHLASSKDGISHHQQKSNTSIFKKDKDSAIRSATGGGILSAETTSTLQPESIITEIERVMVANGIKTVWHGYKVSCAQADIEFEIELCRVKNTYLVGLEFRRVHGSVWAYQSLCRSLMQQWKL